MLLYTAKFASSKKINKSINLLVLQILTSQICKTRRFYIFMKATGIVRRIDDLGRVVIPKEIRRTMRIREGDPLEIYTDREGEVIFKKYSPIGELTSFASQYADTLNKTCGMSVIITDRDVVIACAGVSKKEYTDKKISADTEDIIESRSLYVKSDAGEKLFIIDETSSQFISCAMPIISEGDIVGCIASLSTPDENSKVSHEVEIKLIQTAASFLGKQLEA